MAMDLGRGFAFGFGLLTVLFGGFTGLTSEPMAGAMTILGGCLLMAAVCLARSLEPRPPLETEEIATELLDASTFPKRPFVPKH